MEKEQGRAKAEAATAAGVATGRAEAATAAGAATGRAEAAEAEGGKAEGEEADGRTNTRRIRLANTLRSKARRFAPRE